MKKILIAITGLSVMLTMFSTVSYADTPLDKLRSYGPAYINYFLEDSTRAPSNGLFPAFAHSFLLYRGGASVEDLDVINYGASTYDNILLGMIRLAVDGNTDLLNTYAVAVMPAYINTYRNEFLYYPDPASSSPQYRDDLGNVLIGGPFRMVRINQRVGEWYRKWDFNVDTGAAALLAVYALQANKMFPNKVSTDPLTGITVTAADYRYLAKFMGDYIIKLQDTDGGVRYGPKNMYHAGLNADGQTETNPAESEYYWKLKSTEQNERALYALQALYSETNDLRYDQAATKIKNWLKTMFVVVDSHLFRSAASYKIQTDGSHAWVPSPLGEKPYNYAYIATDVMALAPLELMFTDSYFGDTQVKRNENVDLMFTAIEAATSGQKGKDTTSNFTDSSIGNGRPLLFRFAVFQNFPGQSTSIDTFGSVEMSSHMALAYKKAAQLFSDNGDTVRRDKYIDRYNTLVASLQGFFSPQSDANHLTAPYASIYATKATAGNVPTGTGYATFNCDAALASVYFAFAKAGYDPNQLAGGSGDVSAPTTTDNIADENWRNTSFDVVLTATDSNGIFQTKYSINDAAFQTYTGPITLSDDGAYVIKYYSVDGLGNSEVVKTSKRVRIDKTVPQGTMAVAGGREYVTVRSVDLVFSAIDTGSGLGQNGIEINFDAPSVPSRSSWQPFNYATSLRVDLPDATSPRIIYGRLRDVAGNLSSEMSVSVKVDTTVPSTPNIVDEGEFVNPNATQLIVSMSSQDSESSVVRFTYSILQDSISGASIKEGVIPAQGASGAVNNFAITGLSLQVGKTYYIKARAENAAGLSSAYGYSDGITVNAATGLQISRLDRQTASADEIIAITGRGFGSNKANLRVDFDAIQGYILAVVDAGGTQVITCRVPYAFRSSFNVRVTILSTSEISNPVPLKLRFGDIDGNQKIEGRDITLCVNQIMGRNAQTLAADVDRSGGAIDMTDLFVIVAQAIGDDPFNPKGSYPVELLQAAPIQQIPIGKTLSFKLTAPTKGIAPIYSLKNPPSGMLINRFTGQVTWKPVSNQAGKAYLAIVGVAYTKGQFTVYDEETVVVKVLSSAAALSVKDLTTKPITIKSGAMFFQAQVTPGASNIQSVRLIFERDTSRGRSSGNYAMNYSTSAGTYETYLYKSSPAILKNVSYKIIVTDKLGTRRETAMVNLGDI